LKLPVKKINNIIKSLENYRITPFNFFILLLSICFIRNFLEGFIGYSKTIGTNQDIKITITQMGALFNLEWITLYLFIVLLIYFITKTNIISIFKISLVFYNIIIIVPVLDFFIYFPSGCKIDYLYTVSDYISALLYFFVPFKDIKVCSGIRIEVFFSCIFIFMYIFIKTENFMKSLLGALILYFLAISSMAYPVFILLVFLPVYHGQFDNFVNNFFFTPSFLGSFLNKFSIMIVFLLIPLLLITYKIYYKDKKFLFMIKQIFSVDTFIIFFTIFAGFISGYGFSNFFTSLFNIIFLIFIFIFSFTLNICLTNNFKIEKDIKKILFILLLIFALSISFNNFLMIVLLFSVWYIFNIFEPFIKSIFFDLFFYLFIFIILFISSYTIAPSEIQINPLNLSVIILFSLIYLYRQKRHGN